MSPRFLARWTMVAVVTLLYFATGKLGLALAFVNPNATAIWPPTGIALAAYLLLGARVWPAILAGAFLVNITTSGSGLASLVMAVGNTYEGLLGRISSTGVPMAAGSLSKRKIASNSWYWRAWSVRS